MRLTIIIAVLNSHEIFRRQCIHWGKMNLPDDIEWLILDDGSDPPLTYLEKPIKNFKIHQTHDTRPWTTSIARNTGATIAQSPYILMTDLDHIISETLILRGYTFDGDRMNFKREFAVLDENGNIIQTKEILLAWGLDAERLKKKGFRAPPHGNSFVMRRELFWKCGGYRVSDFGEKYPPMDESHFRGAYRNLMNKGLATTIDADLRPVIYLIPNGYYCGDPDANPFGLFHNLSRSKWGHSIRFKEQLERIARGDR